MALAQLKSIEPQWVDEQIIRAHANSLSEKLHSQRLALHPPIACKTLRKFTSGEVAKLIGVADGYLRQLSLEGKGPQAEVLPNGRRQYTLEDVHALRAYLDETGKSGRQYVKHRTGDEHLQVISCVNFKGGSAKTTTAAHLAQYLALNGYRVLAVDLDPQASLTALHGLQPEIDVLAGQTIYGTIRYDNNARPPNEIVRKTYFPGLDLIPGNLELMEFEHDTPKALVNRDPDDPMFFERIGLTLSLIADSYDVVVIDCPPQLGFLTLSALSASTSMVITVHPQMLDVMSMCQFLTMASDLLEVVKNSGGHVRFDWIRYLITRYEPGDGPQTDMVNFMRSMFSEFVFANPMVKSTAIADAGISKQTLYEVPREQFSKSTYDRAMESLNNVNSEIEGLIKQAWGRI
ncbi:plasmid partitioning protein RepA [Microvirga aerophila]|uniref:Plasmid partitioning protein RepA n=1 Tax=Microvirga aerophila TaxID=670291 RepID=A0A512C1G0_9HYPH|nr:plasmid partitioning protein RepA [Microvirga aerophila]GEO18046.1 plasmid partitioning protein RepA [Microvirga aerophila]